ncbi:MAG: GGDEF domain-containing phosphodiesterase [Woeseiaceae bacterium]|nr:GGDEF domain-containing phosphodiesterase [Woeseiaceae bacterium]
MFEREIQQKMAACEHALSIFVIDMDSVGKLFNHSGSTATTAFLGTVARLLLRMCRDDDRVYRIGQCRFALLLDGLESPVLRQLAAEKVMRLYRSALDDIEPTYNINARIGVASYPEHSDTAGELIQNATLALDSVEDSGGYAVYSPEAVATTRFKRSIQTDFSVAVAERTIDVFFQPKVSIATGRPVGAEALARWEHPEHGQVSPDIFVPLACEIGIIDELTGSIITGALNLASDWPHIGERLAVSVNVDPQTVQTDKFESIIANRQSIWGDNVDLIIEITEAALVADSSSNFERLQSLRSKGIGIAVDDFGTGYSSLSYFRNIPATELKIDRSFVSNMLENVENRKLIETIVSLGKQFDLAVVAEGVECEEQYDMLREMECDIAQGYYISRPLPPDEFSHWLGTFARVEQKSVAPAGE